MPHNADDYAGLKPARAIHAHAEALTVTHAGETYNLVRHEPTKSAGIACLRCGKVSYNPQDIENRYCGFCHQFHAR